MRNEAVLARILEIARRVGDSEGIEIVEVDLAGGGRNRLLRIYIDKPEGVTHADCELISLHVGTMLDVEDAVPGGSYTLEVSSPGVERKLTRPQDFIRFRGKPVKVVLREPVDNRRHWEGVLEGFQDGVLTLATPQGQPVSFPLEQVQRANLKFVW